MIHHFWSKKVKVLKNNKIIKLLFQLVISTYLLMGLLKFRAVTLVGCKIQFLIQEVPMLHTFDEPYYMKNNKYMKNLIAIMFFHLFLNFCVEESIESMQDGYSLEEEINFASN